MEIHSILIGRLLSNNISAKVAYIESVIVETIGL
jgi:hypothetical protein